MLNFLFIAGILTNPPAPPPETVFHKDEVSSLENEYLTFCPEDRNLLDPEYWNDC